MPIRCEIVDQNHIVFAEDVDIVTLPGAAGELGVLPHHAPVLTVLQLGVIRVKQKGKEKFFTVSGGVAEVQPDQVTILADAAESVEEIDIDRAEQARKRVEEILAQGVPADPDVYLQIKSALKRSNLRIDAARRYRNRPPHGS